MTEAKEAMDLTLPRWLRRAPSAVKVRAMLEDGTERIVNVGDPKDNRRWGKCARTLLGLRAVKVEALDAKGDVLRVVDLEDDEQAQERADKKKREREAAESSRVQIARLLKEAYTAGAEAHAEAYKTAFNMNTNMANAVIQAFTKNVTMINGLLRRLAVAEAGTEGEGGGAVERMLAGAIMGGMVPETRGPGRPTNAERAARNGAAHDEDAPEAED